MLILSETAVRQALRMKDCLEANRQALISLATGTAVVPSRLGIPYHDGNSNNNNSGAEDWTLFKPAALQQLTDDDNQTTQQLMLGCKIVSIRGQNPTRYQLPTVPASIVDLNPATGLVQAVLAGTYLTAARTAAGSALATAYRFNGNGSTSNNNDDSSASASLKHLVVFGAGLQAELHVQAIATAMGGCIPRVTLINRTAPRAVALQQKLLQLYGPDTTTTTEQQSNDNDDNDRIVLPAVDTAVLDDTVAVKAALTTANCIVTATNTSTPLFDFGSLVPAGCHVNGIGSYTPDMQEVPRSMVDRCTSSIWIDTPEATAVGDLKHLLPQQDDDENSRVQLLGDLLLQQQEQNDDIITTPPADCTFYKAVGTAIQDVMTANIVVQRAHELGIGVHVDMS